MRYDPLHPSKLKCPFRCVSFETRPVDLLRSFCLCTKEFGVLLIAAALYGDCKHYRVSLLHIILYSFFLSIDDCFYHTTCIPLSHRNLCNDISWLANFCSVFWHNFHLRALSRIISVLAPVIFRLISEYYKNTRNNDIEHVEDMLKALPIIKHSICSIGWNSCIYT